MLVFLFLLGSFQGAQADLPYQICILWFYFFGFGTGDLYRFELVWYNALCVELFDLTHSFYRNGVLLVTIGQYVPHQIFEDIFFDEGGVAFTNLDHICIVREMLECIKIGIQLVVKTAFQTATLTAEFALVDGKVLVTGGSRID